MFTRRFPVERTETLTRYCTLVKNQIGRIVRTVDINNMLNKVNVRH